MTSQVPSNNSHRRTMTSAPIYDQRTALERTFFRLRSSSRVSISTSGRAGTTKTIYSTGRTDSQRKYSEITPQAPPHVLFSKRRSVLTRMPRSRTNLRSEAQRHQSKVENPVQYSTDKRRQPKRIRSTGEPSNSSTSTKERRKRKKTAEVLPSPIVNSRDARSGSTASCPSPSRAANSRIPSVKEEDVDKSNLLPWVDEFKPTISEQDLPVHVMNDPRLSNQPTKEDLCKPIPPQHKFVHVLNHYTAWNDLTPKGIASLADIHDPGLTPGGLSNATEFHHLYPLLREPQVIVTSHLRRCLQTAVSIAKTLTDSGKAADGFRVIASPDLQEVSEQLCDTGSPLDVLRAEFPSVEFPEALFDAFNYPRPWYVKPEKSGTDFGEESHLLAKRAERIRKFLRESLHEREIILITHSSFSHYLFNLWSGEPGKSNSSLFAILQGQARPYLLPESPSAGPELLPFCQYLGPWYLEDETVDCEWEPWEYGEWDCGVFTDFEILKHLSYHEKAIKRLGKAS